MSSEPHADAAMAETAAPGAAVEAHPERAPASARLGRFELLDEIGAGAMGTVYSAYDPMLDRRVAVKLLHGATGDDQRARLRREAHAMARLSHPNVVQIYDVGQRDARLWLAMEFVEGCTLDAWQRRVPHHWSALVRMYARVGAGLAAAHGVSLLHRDFKPQNVIVGDDGRPRVIDFGLARQSGAQRVGVAPVAMPDGALGEPLTVVGAIVGTPAYMAPEQWRGEPATPASDQFAFCVALYEALFGAAPFPRESVRGLRTAVLAGDLRPPTRPEVPAWLVELVVRGLAPEPAERWPSMQALLDALSARIEDVDVAVGGRTRRIWVSVMLAVTIGQGAWAVASGTVLELSAGLITAIVWLLGGLTFWWWLRRSKSENAFNRPLAAWTTITPLGFIANRAGCLYAGTPAETAYQMDLVIFGTTTALVAALGLPWAGWIAAVFYVGVAVSYVAVDHIMSVLTVTVTVAFVLLILFIARALGRQRRGRSAGLLGELGWTATSRLERTAQARAASSEPRA